MCHGMLFGFKVLTGSRWCHRCQKKWKFHQDMVQLPTVCYCMFNPVFFGRYYGIYIYWLISECIPYGALMPFVWCSPGRCSGGSVFRAKAPTCFTGMSFGSSLWKMGVYPLHSPYIGVIYGRYLPKKDGSWNGNWLVTFDHFHQLRWAPWTG